MKRNLTGRNQNQSGENNAEKYVCDHCGFEYNGQLAALPDDYQCPVCNMGIGHFIKKR